MDTYVGCVGRWAWLDKLHQEIRANDYTEASKIEYLSVISDYEDYCEESVHF